MIDKRLDMSLEPGENLFCQLHLRIGADTCQKPVTSALEYRYVQVSFARKIVVQKVSRYTRVRDDVLEEGFFIGLLCEQRGSDVEQLFASLLWLHPSYHVPPPPTFGSDLPNPGPLSCK